MDSKYLIDFLNKKNISTITRKKKTYLTYAGFEQQYTYVLKDGVIKTSIIQKDGREFNISYIKGPDIISILKDEISSFTSSPFNVRIESETATFYTVPRVLFWEYVNSDKNLQNYVKEYYRENLSKAIRRQQLMIMNGKTGAVCAFLYDLVNDFGKKFKSGYIIDFQVTNEDIGGFCGISTVNSVNRILHQLKDDGIIDIKKQRIIVKDLEFLKQYTIEDV